MNPTYIRIEIIRQLRDAMNLMFVIALPVAMYVLFGFQGDARNQDAGHGNVAFYALGSMAMYGAAVAAASIAGTAAAENMQGWGRTLALTKAPRIGHVLNKAVVALLVAVIAITVVHAVGYFTGAETDAPGTWWATLGITLAVLPMWAVYGLAVGLLFRSESAVGIASAALTFLAFFGNLFLPLSGTMLAVARWTPMFGAAGLVRWPLTEGQTQHGQEELWQLMVNALVWLVVFLLLAVWGMKRSTSRR